MKHKVTLWVVILLGILGLGWVDWQTGYEFNFFAFYFTPVGVAAWFLGLGPAVIVAVMSALVWYGADFLSGDPHSSQVFAVWNTMIRLISFLIVGWSLHKIHVLLVSERDKSAELYRYLSHIKVLEGLLPICSVCKKIRDDRGRWERMESYIAAHSNAQFSHGYCPECAQRAMKEAGLIPTGRAQGNG